MTGSLDGVTPLRAVVAAPARCVTLYNFTRASALVQIRAATSANSIKAGIAQDLRPFKYCREHVTGEGVLDALGRAKPGSPSLDFARTDYAVGGKHTG